MVPSRLSAVARTASMAGIARSAERNVFDGIGQALGLGGIQILQAGSERIHPGGEFHQFSRGNAHRASRRRRAGGGEGLPDPSLVPKGGRENLSAANGQHGAGFDAQLGAVRSRGFPPQLHFVTAQDAVCGTSSRLRVDAMQARRRRWCGIFNPRSSMAWCQVRRSRRHQTRRSCGLSPVWQNRTDRGFQLLPG